MVIDLHSSTLIDLLFEKSKDFIGIYDLGGKRFVRVNQAGVEMIGYSSEPELLGDSDQAWSLRIQPLADSHLDRLIEHVIRGEQHNESIRINRHDGQPSWGHFTMRICTEHDPSLALIRIVDQGLEGEHAVHLMNHTQRVEFERVMEQAPVGVVVIRGPQYVIEWANLAVCTMWGHLQAQSLYTPLFTLLPEAAGQGLEPALDGVLATGVPYVANEWPLTVQRRGQPETVYWNFVCQPLIGTDRRVMAVMMVATDVTEQVLARQCIQTLNKELAGANEQLRVNNAGLEQKVANRTHALLTTLDQLEQSKDELTRALVAEQKLGELKSRFVTMASHEFRTPLTIIQTSATLAEKFADAHQQDERRKYLDRIRVSVKHLNDILEEFLLIGKLEEGVIVPHPAEVDLTRLVNDTVADMQDTLKPGQTVQTHLSCPSAVWLDPSLLRKILINLLSNAVKYSGPGSAVTVRATAVAGTVTLSVADQGVGIPPDDQAHLFERFFRASNVSTIAGTGLGLHIVGRYVMLMGGSVSLHSELNQGTTIILSLPYDDDSAD